MCFPSSFFAILTLFFIEEHPKIEITNKNATNFFILVNFRPYKDTKEKIEIGEKNLKFFKILGNSGGVKVRI